MRIHIKAIKYIILIVAVLLLSILLMYTQPQVDLVPLPKTSRITIDEQDKPSIENLKEKTTQEKAEEVLEKTVTQAPNFTGEDKNEKVWNLQANQAVQTGQIGIGITELVDVVAKTLSATDKKIDYIANEGQYIPAENKVNLKGDVILKSEELTLTTQELDYNLVTGFAETKSRTLIKSDIGQIEGDILKSYDNAERLVLTGNVHAILYKEKKKRN